MYQVGMGWSVGGRVEVQLGYVEKVRLYHGLGIDRLAPTKYQLKADMEKSLNKSHFLIYSKTAKIVAMFSFINCTQCTVSIISAQ